MMPRAVVTLMVLAIALGASPAFAQQCEEKEILIEFSGNVFGKAGDVVQVAQVAVDPDLIGASCTSTATVENNSSAHPGNDLIISSGTASVVIADFEREAGKVTAMSTGFELGEVLTASIRLGPHGIASLAGDNLVVASICQPQAPPTTTTTTTIPPATASATTLPPATTTTETPVGAVSAGGGSTAAAGTGAVVLLSFGGLAMLGALGIVAYSHKPTRP